jgi:uncharacterized membrane protein YfcA
VWEVLTATALAVAAGAFAQSVTGFGFAMVAIPLVSFVLGPVDAVVVVTVVACVLTLGASRRHRSDVQWSVAVRMVLAGVLGMPVGLAALTLLDDRVLAMGIAVVIGVFAVLAFVGFSLERSTPVMLGAGVTSGVFLTATGVNGPPLVAALQAMGFGPRQMRATLQATFAAQDVLAVAGFVVVGQLHGRTWLLAAVGVPGLVVGWLLGEQVFERVDQRVFRVLVLVVLLVSAVLLFVNGLRG